MDLCRVVKYRKTKKRLKDLEFAAKGLRNPEVEKSQSKCDLAQKIIESLPIDGLVNPLIIYKNHVYIGQNRLIALRFHARKDIIPKGDLRWNFDSLIDCIELLEKPTPDKLQVFYLEYENWDEKDKELRKKLGQRALENLEK